MPELPEVEVTRRSIDGPLRGARVRNARLGKPLRWPLGIDPQQLQGRTIGPIVRRGKYRGFPCSGRPPTRRHLASPGHVGSLALLPDEAPGRTITSTWTPTVACCA
jgi:formamidopyrimidine-DNA glycosylase